LINRTGNLQQPRSGTESAAGKLDCEVSKINQNVSNDKMILKKKSTLGLISAAIKTSSKIDFDKL
jgi:hypothetical protein